jgi:hypothetical protein
MSLAGVYGKTVNELAHYFIKHEYYDIAGTDLHNTRHFSQLQSSSIAHGLKELLDAGKLAEPRIVNFVRTFLRSFVIIKHDQIHYKGSGKSFGN